jgi:SAM-dependent methyltransferase
MKTALVLVVYALLTSPVGLALAQTPHTHHHGFGDAEKWSKVFDDPQRDAWQKPHEVIKALALQPDAIAADVGAGTGYFSVRLAHMLPKGRVYAVDTEPDMVKHLAERAKRNGLKNLLPIAGKPDDPRLPEKVDVILFVDVYHHIGDRERYFRKLIDALKADGRIAIIDFHLDSPIGPPKAARIPADRVKSELKVAGYEVAQDYAFLPNQYFLVFRPPAKP